MQRNEALAEALKVNNSITEIDLVRGHRYCAKLNQALTKPLEKNKLFQGIANSNVRLIEAAIEKYPDFLNQKKINNQEILPIYHAVNNNSFAILNKLIELGADYKITSSQNEQSIREVISPVYQKFSSANLDQKILNLLDDPESPVLAEPGSIEANLINLCRSTLEKDHGKKEILTEIKELITLGTRLNIKDKNNQSPLYHAIKSGKDQVADFLISHGAALDEASKRIIDDRKLRNNLIIGSFSILAMVSLIGYLNRESLQYRDFPSSRTFLQAMINSGNEMLLLGSRAYNEANNQVALLDSESSTLALVGDKPNPNQSLNFWLQVLGSTAVGAITMLCQSSSLIKLLGKIFLRIKF